MLTINGYPVHLSWGRNSIPLPPGRHHLQIHIPYLIPPRLGPAELLIHSRPGDQIHLQYTAPGFAFFPGSLGSAPQPFNGLFVQWILIAFAVFCVFVPTVAIALLSGLG
ncbi:hypothetical protein OIE66_03475 [Nonomuraea sp. NBC_01738]|uniref:hypothetical protein n=1 Tax=Nonomuraea sp. NBC_01738 TaxID=2976003 RepID=UPI002E1069F3|nr:hypothetical protein OIE66_03475 [Nonomuraea sp. NBC_01738]